MKKEKIKEIRKLKDLSKKELERLLLKIQWSILRHQKLIKDNLKELDELYPLRRKLKKLLLSKKVKSK